MKLACRFLWPLPLGMFVAGISLAQNWGWGGRGNIGPIVRTEGHDGEGGVEVDERTVRTAREIASHSSDTPNWTNRAGFEKDVFTFVRVMYQFGTGPRNSHTASHWGWITDFPDSDLNLSYRLQQVTSIKADPDARVIRLTDPALFNYPWIYMVEPGRMVFRDEEVPILQKYLLNGGVLMADDFWGTKQWDNFEYEIKRVLPRREFVDLPMTHEIFHCVFDLKVPMNKLQTPNSSQGSRSLNPYSRWYGVTWEMHDGEACRDMHVRALYDDKGRMMILAAHNCDNGDGWEREGEDDGFFHEFSEKRAYPLGINMVFYLMTH
jgi:hypothetical protein